MPRPRRCRRVWFQPGITFFKPVGVRLTELDVSILTVDELEAIRLKDLQNLEQEPAAKKMNISQPTFHRLLLSARKKIADALVNGKAIKIQGGNYKMQPPRRVRARFRGPPSICVCSKCGCQQPKIRGSPCSRMKCPDCGGIMVRGD